MTIAVGTGEGTDVGMGVVGDGVGLSVVPVVLQDASRNASQGCGGVENEHGSKGRQTTSGHVPLAYAPLLHSVMPTVA